MWGWLQSIGISTIQMLAIVITWQAIFSTAKCDYEVFGGNQDN